MKPYNHYSVPFTPPPFQVHDHSLKCATSRLDRAFTFHVDAFERPYVPFQYQPGYAYSLDEAWDNLPHHFKPLCEKIFDEARKHVSTLYDLFVFFIGNIEADVEKDSVFAHYHPAWNGEFVQTLTGILPIFVVDPITEKIVMRWIDTDLPKGDAIFGDVFFKICKQAWEDAGQEHEISFPEQGQLAFLDFDSSHWVHKVEGVSNNIYMVVVFNEYQSII